MRVGIASIHYSQSPQYTPFVEQRAPRHESASPLLVPRPTKMSSQDESARLFQKMVVFKYAADNIWKQSKEVLVNRDTVAQYEVRGVIIVTAARTRAR